MNARATPSEEEAFGGSDREVALLRIPPHSIESEISVLGALLLDNAGWDRIGDLLTEADFYRYEHRMIFSAIGALVTANKPADVVTVFDRLEAMGKAEDAGGLAYLNQLSQYTPSAGNFYRYAEIVRERAILRRLVAASDIIATAAFNPGTVPVSEILDQAEQQIFDIGQNKTNKGDDWQESDAGMVEFLDGIQARHDGEDTDYVPTGLAALDDKIDGGMRKGEVYVIAGRPGMGKTALALTIGEHVAKVGKEPVTLLSMEMPRQQVQMRRVSMDSHIPLHKLKRPERMSDFDWSSLTRTVDLLSKVKFTVSDKTSLTINQVRSKARAIKRRHGLRVLIIDYIGLMEGTDAKENRTAALGKISRGIKALAKELDCTILLLAQLNREVEKRVNQRPILSDLRECGDIEQDADVVLFVYRPIHANRELGDEWKFYAELIIGKQRDGEAGAVIDIGYDGPQVRFYNWSGDAPKTLAKAKGKEL
jgi:replicative DNA helicase